MIREFHIRICTLLVFVLVFNWANALEKGDLNFYHLGVRDGLSMNTIQYTYQDHIGNVWIGTLDGLNRYDGYEIKSYFHDFSDSLSLSENHISQIAEDSNNQLWIATINGLCRYVPETDNFKRYPVFGRQNIFGLLKSSENDFYVVTSRGIFIYDPEYDQFSENKFISRFLGQNGISSRLFEIEKGNYLFLIGTRPFIYTPEKRNIEEIPIGEEITANVENLRFMSSVKLADKHFYLGNMSRGLYELKKENKVIKRIKIPPKWQF